MDFKMKLTLWGIGVITAGIVIVGTTAAIAEIFLHESSVNTTGGDKVTQDSIDDGAITLESIQFKYPTKKEV